MNNVLTKAILVATIVLTVFSVSVMGQDRPATPLTNASVIKLVRAGFKEKTVIAIIHSRPNTFNLEPDRLIDLKRNGVSENIILTMLASGDAQVSDGDEWADDSFFRGASPNKSKSDPGVSGSTDIFGSGGSSSSETKTRGGRQGADQGQTETTGSATVRIIRPPVEAGGGSQLKLEKTPTLNNESIINLVEAGFSEGTIIKRIENSPADFDMSPAKISDLRKRRVTEPIIAAMTAAMQDADPKSATTNPGREN